MMREENKEYEIWIGSYDLGQGYGQQNSEPTLIDKIVAPNFRVACVLYELRSSLRSIERRVASGEYIDHQSCRWFYNFDSNTNSWTGKYYETREEALSTFK